MYEYTYMILSSVLVSAVRVLETVGVRKLAYLRAYTNIDIEGG